LVEDDKKEKNMQCLDYEIPRRSLMADAGMMIDRSSIARTAFNFDAMSQENQPVHSASCALLLEVFSFALHTHSHSSSNLSLCSSAPFLASAIPLFPSPP
jgi:hypothetical protein